MLSDEECREIWQTSLARCHPMNDISVAGIRTAKAAFALGIERARNAPDAATRAVIERLVEALVTINGRLSRMYGDGLSDRQMAAIADARKLLEGDAPAQPADEDAWLFRSLVWRFEEDRDMGPGGYWRASVHTADPKIRNDLRKVLIAAATKGDGK